MPRLDELLNLYGLIVIRNQIFKFINRVGLKFSFD